MMAYTVSVSRRETPAAAVLAVVAVVANHQVGAVRDDFAATAGEQPRILVIAGIAAAAGWRFTANPVAEIGAGLLSIADRQSNGVHHPVAEEDPDIRSARHDLVGVFADGFGHELEAHITAVGVVTDFLHRNLLAIDHEMIIEHFDAIAG
jgi:hypothetical protein